MKQAKLYLFIGYPGAGKTTIAKTIAERTGAVHLWADVERHKMFSHPTHSAEESQKLYKDLNEMADKLLASGQSVIFDTNFNHLADRQHLRDIARKNQAETVTIWVTTNVELSKKRSVDSHQSRNLYEMLMTDRQFDNIVSKLEPPSSAENVIKLDGANLGQDQIIKALSL